MYENVQKTIKNYKKLLQKYFGDIEVGKHKSHQNNSPIFFYFFFIYKNINIQYNT